MAKGATYTLAVLLKLNDRLSGQTRKSIAALKALDDQADATLRGIQKLNKALAKPLAKPPAAATKHLPPAARAPRPSRLAPELDKAARAHAQLSAQQAADASRVLRLKQQETRLDTVQTRAAREQARLATEAATHSLRIRREESRLTQANARARRESQRAASGAELDDLRVMRERGRLQRDSEGHGHRRGARRGLFGATETADDFFDATRQIKYAARDRFDSLRQYTDETLRLYRTQEQFKVIGLPEAENARVFETVRQTTGRIKGLTVADTQDLATDLYGALGDVNQALRALPDAAKFRLGFETVFADKMGREEINNQVRSAYKFLELTGKTQRGEGEMNQMLDVLSGITASTGGRVTPSDILLMARRGNPAVQGLSTTGLRNLSSLVEDMGPEQTGTAMMSLYQALVAGVMKQSAAERFDYYGLLDRSKIKFGKAQQIKRLLPGANLLGPLLQEDPMKAADLLMERFRAKGVDTSDERAVQSELSVLFGNRNAFRLMNMMATQRPQIMKESGRAAMSKGSLAVYEQMKATPMMRLKEAEAEWTNFKSEFGKPLIETAAALSRSLTPVAEFFSRHPDVTRYGAQLLLVSKGLGFVVESGAVLSRASTGRWFSHTATEADRLRRVIDQTPASFGRAGAAMDGASKKAERLKGQLGFIQTMSALKLTIGLTAVGAGVEIISWMIEENKKRKAEEDRRKAVVAGTYGEATQKQIMYGGRRVGEQNREAFETLAGQSLDVIRMMPEFKRGIQPEHTQGGKFSIMEAATSVRSRTELNDPNVLSKLLRMIDQGRAGLKSADEGARFKEILSRAFPEQFKLATQINTDELMGASKHATNQFLAVGVALSDMLPRFAGAGEGLGKLQEPLPSLNDQLGSMLGAVRPLPPGLFAFDRALGSLTARINSLEIKPPTFDFNQPPPSQGQAGPRVSRPTPAQRPRPSAPWLNLDAPPSAIGSVIQKDGLVYGHKGNVLFPAKLSRRRPGDWLESATAINRALRGRDDSRTGGGVHVPRPLSFDDLRAQRSSTAAPARGRDAFDLRQALAVEYADGGGGPVVVNIGDISVNVPAGSRAAEDPRELARLVAAEVRRALDDAGPFSRKGQKRLHRVIKRRVDGEGWGDE